MIFDLAYSCLFWSSLLSVPLLLTYYDFPKDPDSNSEYLGLVLGITSVAVGQTVTVIYYTTKREIQLNEIFGHLIQPEGFLLLIGYLTITWNCGWIPSSYYSFEGNIQWIHVAELLLLQDFIQYGMHMIEHKYSKYHRHHHRFIHPKMFDAFNGSYMDTICMILIPLFISCQIVPANVWSYMTFGTIYANWLTLIHSEFSHPWDPVFKRIGFGTPHDHHMHHQHFNCNYGHMFMYWDIFFKTYKS